MELRQLVYFVEVAKREHVSEAAFALHVAQSAVSRQISNLETELGVALFEREGRNIKLTTIGKLFLTHTETALKAIDNAKQLIDEHLDPERGTIKIGFPTSLASHTLPTVISAFKGKHPNVAFHLRQGSYKFLIDAVKNREIDLAFLGPVPRDDNDVEGTILFSEKILALLPSNHPLASKERIRLDQLRNDAFVLFPKGYVLHRLAIDACKQSGFKANVSSVGEDLDAIKGLVSAGIGVTLLPESTLYETMPKFTVKVPIEFPHVTRTVGMIIPKHRKLAPSEQLFYEFVKDFFSILQQYS
ncbi:LysR family transcriptional regulator [Priestia endophytica]|jgi:LysR family transcriptional regulator, transcription activator of glutamate synthase operon|uniref:LysR family transcriptional regulator n=2 Tax=Priestia endophytica TaxID=135735 RepID=A0AAX1Q175_9BACI|nr:LysR family transcriptional regulator [Priestia endophytica]KAB2492628.1 LysR family transcriptional regulator [Priestia endophytica]KYG25674.1 LysR family transcriptional regulator [Priestia endophytica]MBG9811289.1 LysR family transcriptional regulator [Priestia endophytica]MCM3537245.1 LysR family transcriptional regulator [Priestia endophytica]RAS71740.1 LysR family transcriptional regulator [Priestia endophytica]